MALYLTVFWLSGTLVAVIGYETLVITGPHDLHRYIINKTNANQSQTDLSDFQLPAHITALRY